MLVIHYSDIRADGQNSAPKKCGRSLGGERTAAASLVGRTKSPGVLGLAISMIARFPVVAAFGLILRSFFIPRDEGQHTRAPSRCLAYVGMKSLRIP